MWKNDDKIGIKLRFKGGREGHRELYAQYVPLTTRRTTI